MFAEISLLKNTNAALAGVCQLVGALSHELKVCRFNPQPGHIPRLWVQPPGRLHTEGSGSMFLFHTGFIFLSLSPPSSLPLPLSLKAMKKCPQVRIKKKNMNVILGGGVLIG